MRAAPHADDAAALRDAILARCRALGFAAAGVAPASPSARADALRRWLAEGRHGEMAYLARHAEVREDPDLLLPGAQAIVCVVDRYGPGETEAEAPDDDAPATGRIARYARGDDYHVVMKRRLHALADGLRERFPDDRFRACVDTAPLPEREHAERAGLGAVGKHTLLIERGAGSYLLLGALVTTLPIAPTPPVEPDPCGTCTRCIDACPTGAITPWSVDATRCISYLTIEHRGAIDERFFDAMDDWIFGCDICQEVCPHNQPKDGARRVDLHEAYRPRRASFDLAQVLGWTEEDRRLAFRKSAMKRAKLPMMKRNALVAAGNVLARGDDPALRARIDSIIGDADEDPMVRATAEAVRRR